MPYRVNQDVAGRLEEAGRLLRDQGADAFRVNAYRHAAMTVRESAEPVDEIFRHNGLDGLKALRGVGDTIARAIRELLVHGRLPMLDRLRGESDPVSLLESVPGIGGRLAERLHDELGLETLADLEAAAHDGRLDTIAGIGEKRLTGIRGSLAHRLGRVRLRPIVQERATGAAGVATARTGSPPVSELLDVDREYREKVSAGQLQLIAPRRFNPTGQAWLPILHAQRADRHYTALYSNTARAHGAGKTKDWVVLYHDDGSGERLHTVITGARGSLLGRRVVAGRESECLAFYVQQAA